MFQQVWLGVGVSMSGPKWRIAILTFHHLAISTSSLFIAACKISGSLTLIKRFVLSAKPQVKI